MHESFYSTCAQIVPFLLLAALVERSIKPKRLRPFGVRLFMWTIFGAGAWAEIGSLWVLSGDPVVHNHDAVATRASVLFCTGAAVAATFAAIRETLSPKKEPRSS